MPARVRYSIILSSKCRVPTILQSVDRDHVLLQLLDYRVCAGSKICKIRAASVDSKAAVESQKVCHTADTAQHVQGRQRYRVLCCNTYQSLTLVAWLYTNVDSRDVMVASQIEQRANGRRGQDCAFLTTSHNDVSYCLNQLRAFWAFRG